MFNLFNTLISANVFSFISLLDLLCLLSVMFGVYVINSKNPIVSVLFLIALFVSISLNLILLGYNFIGLSYLLVYVGAISILFLFILMLINVRTSELLNDTNNGIPLAMYAGLLFSYPFFFTLNKDNTIVDSKKIVSLPSGAPSGTKDDNKKSFEDIIFYDDTQLSFCVLSSAGKDNIKNQDFKGVLLNKKDSELYYASSNAWDNNLTDINDITSIGNVLYSTYGVWLIICSIILLLAMIGAITITKKEKD